MTSRDFCAYVVAGAEAYGRVWAAVKRNCALVAAAALPHIQAEHAGSRLPPGMCFEVRQRAAARVKLLSSP